MKKVSLTLALIMSNGKEPSAPEYSRVTADFRVGWIWGRNIEEIAFSQAARAWGNTSKVSIYREGIAAPLWEMDLKIPICVGDQIYFRPGNIKLRHAS